MNTSSNTKLIAKDIAKFYKGYKRHVRIVCLQGGVSIYVDGEKIVTASLPYILQSKLNLSFRAHDGGDVSVANLRLSDLIPPISRSTKGSTLKLINDQMEILFDDQYPVPVHYKLLNSGNVIRGAVETTGAVLIFSIT